MYTFLYVQVRRGNGRLYDNRLAMKLFFMALDVVVNENPPQGGLVLVVDVAQLGLVHVVRTDLGLTRRMLHYLYQGLNTRLTAVHLLNVSWLARKFLTILRPFITSQIYSLVRTKSFIKPYESMNKWKNYNKWKNRTKVTKFVLNI